MVPGAARAQRVLTEAERVISVAKGRSALYQHPGAIARISVGDPNVVDVQLVSEREIVVNARELGTTSLFVWTARGACTSSRSRSRRTHPGWSATCAACSRGSRSWWRPVGTP